MFEKIATVLLQHYHHAHKHAHRHASDSHKMLSELVEHKLEQYHDTLDAFLLHVEHKIDRHFARHHAHEVSATANDEDTLQLGDSA